MRRPPRGCSDHGYEAHALGVYPQADLIPRHEPVRFGERDVDRARPGLHPHPGERGFESCDLGLPGIRFRITDDLHMLGTEHCGERRAHDRGERERGGIRARETPVTAAPPAVHRVWCCQRTCMPKARGLCVATKWSPITPFRAAKTASRGADS